MTPAGKQKILFVITKSNWGGAQRYVYDLAVSLRTDYEISVALGGDGRLFELLKAQSIPTHAIEGLTRDVSFKDELRSFRSLYRLFREARPDIVHLNSSKAGALGALAARLARVPHIVFTAHAWAWNENRPFFARIAIALLHWSTVLLAHRTICVSNHVYDQMASFPFTRRRMRVIHPGITPLPHLSREQARTQFFARIPTLAARSDDPWIATIAELHPVKGLPYLVEALALLTTLYPRLVHIIMGDGEEHAKLERMIKERGLTSTIFLAGHVSDAPALLSAFDLFVLPSLSESFGYVLLEAGAAQVPVIASRVGGIPEIVEDDCGTLVPPQNAALLADAMSNALRDSTLRSAASSTLAGRVRSYFTRERMTEETIALYRDLMR